jgi:CBS domain-containing protein/ribosome-associated translation inhibitor RaiA
MKVLDIAKTKVFSLDPDETVGKALSIMSENKIHQIPIIDSDSIYRGMIFAKQFVSINALPDSKVRSFICNTPILDENDQIEKCAQLMIVSANRALPLLDNGRLTGLISETDILKISDFGHANVDEVMSGAIVIEEQTTLGNALSKMRRYNISRLPIINTKGVLVGIVNALDIAGVISTPRERSTKSKGIGSLATIRDLEVKSIMKRSISVERGTRVNDIISHFNNYEEIVVVGDRRPIGIITPKDILELILPRISKPTIHVAHLVDEVTRSEIEMQMHKFLEKIQGKLGDVHLVVVYVDKHKTRKYSMRARLNTDRGVIDAKGVAFDPMSACKVMISRLDRRIKSEHSQRVSDRKHARTARGNIG